MIALELFPLWTRPEALLVQTPTNPGVTDTQARECAVGRGLDAKSPKKTVSCILPACSASCACTMSAAEIRLSELDPSSSQVHFLPH
jgi:hypothetical protein